MYCILKFIDVFPKIFPSRYQQHGRICLRQVRSTFFNMSQSLVFSAVVTILINGSELYKDRVFKVVSMCFSRNFFDYLLVSDVNRSEEYIGFTNYSYQILEWRQGCVGSTIICFSFYEYVYTILCKRIFDSKCDVFWQQRIDHFPIIYHEDLQFYKSLPIILLIISCLQ